MDKLREKLIDLGLKDKEAEVYLAVLSTKKSTVTDINKKSDIARTNIYQYLEALLKKGLIYKTTTKKRIHYSAEDPKKIIAFLNREQRKIEEKKNNIEKIMPELKNIFSDSLEKPAIKFYEGREGIQSIYKEIVATHKNIYSVFSAENFFKLFTYKENHEILMKLQSNGGMLYNLMEKSEETTRRLRIKEYDSFVKTKILPERIKFKTDLLVAGDALALISFKNLVGIVIEDQAIADMQRSMIKLLWKTIK
jgi:HTH-type transcriptional regulator, sugar sensing transcriptional regulator